MTKSKFKVYFPSDNNNKHTFTSNKLTKDSNFTIFLRKNTIFSRLNNESIL